MTQASILRLPEVIHRTGLSRSSIYLQVSKGTFPSPIKLGARASGWVEADINDWVDKRIAMSRPTPLPNPF